MDPTCFPIGTPPLAGKKSHQRFQTHFCFYTCSKDCQTKKYACFQFFEIPVRDNSAGDLFGMVKT